jgi:hypothetical protein
MALEEDEEQNSQSQAAATNTNSPKVLDWNLSHMLATNKDTIQSVYLRSGSKRDDYWVDLN